MSIVGGPATEGRSGGADGPSPGGRRVTRRSRAVHRVLAAAARRGTAVEKEILGLADLVDPGDVCLDVGAEFGLYTHVLADLVGPGGAVHAFEPQRGAHRALRLGVRAAGLTWVHLHRVALGAVPGTAELSVPRRRGLPVHGRAFLTAGACDDGPNREFPRQRLETVAVETLDTAVADLVPGRLALVKADVEGAEGALLDGGAATLADHRPHLLLEIEDRHTRKYGVGADALFARLTGELGYRAHTWSAGWRPVTGIVDTERNYLFSP
ncbi:FkbM family methyltransferase [Actinomycetospora straminea]|uniref:FkbM family methyltransferase n=1 Tax=Actinomycetospora straminea TaxID=663607 RepID=A0ABP9E874_9PSEU|nr:FkbM family methyltransferase [Actinomycetospora straminea]MDD7932808.1 FkbM family methyltransferase [Actinomycetospora straminea]